MNDTQLWLFIISVISSCRCSHHKSLFVVMSLHVMILRCVMTSDNKLMKTTTWWQDWQDNVWLLYRRDDTWERVMTTPIWWHVITIPIWRHEMSNTYMMTCDENTDMRTYDDKIDMMKTTSTWRYTDNQLLWWHKLCIVNNV